MEASERFYQNRACPYFPCHKGIGEEELNCIFCYCPLYALGRACGGGWHYLENGVKDCSACVFPHRPENYSRILARYPDLMAVAARTDREGLPKAAAGGGREGLPKAAAGSGREGVRHED